MNLDELMNILKRMEGVYKVSTDPKQKERVKNEINNIKDQIRKLDRYGPEETLETDEEQEKQIVGNQDQNEIVNEENFPILSKIEIKSPHPKSTNHEVNSIITYIENFEFELWGALSDFHLKLDYFHSKERDKFYNALEKVKRLIREYIHVLDEFNQEVNESYTQKLQLMKTKHTRALIIDAVKFIASIKEYVNNLLTDYHNDGNLILNPKDSIRFSNIDGTKILQNWNLIDALTYINDFCSEVIDSINLPDEMVNLE
jgi:hypothetical protein